jgi:WD40 repeat protein
MHRSVSPHIIFCACNDTIQQKFAQQSPRLQPMPVSYGYTVKAKGGGLVQQYVNVHLQHGLHLHQHTGAASTVSTITAAGPQPQQQQQQQQPTLAISNASHSKADTTADAPLLLLAQETVKSISIAPVTCQTELSNQLALVSTDNAVAAPAARQQHNTNNSESSNAAAAQQRRGAMGQIPLSEPSHSTDVTALISNEAHRTAAAAHDGLLHRLRTQHGSLCCHHGTVNALAWSHDETRLATAGSDGCVKLWDPNVLYTTTNSDDNSSDGNSIHSKVYDAGVCYGVHKGGALSVSWSPDSLFLASCGADSSIMIWSTATLCAVRTLRGHCDVVHSVTFAQSAIGRAVPVPDTISSPSAALLLLSCGGEGDVKLWDLAPVS